jgi:hypothetical protein
MGVLNEKRCKDYLIFKEDRIISSDPVFTCYQFPFNNILIVPYLNIVFSSEFIYGTASAKKGIINTKIHLFRFFDDTYCGCGLEGGGGNKDLPGGSALCPGTTKNDIGPPYDFSTADQAYPGAIILVDRASEINTVSGSPMPTYVTRPLSNAIIDYCKKSRTTPKELLPNLIWDEDLKYV